MEEKKELQIEIQPDVADGKYSNLAIIGHSASEFIIDFLAVMPNTPKAKVKSRVIMTPENAKRLAMALNENIHKYEGNFGEIDVRKGVIVTPNKINTLTD
ncbi:MAG: DUF3467 domain-containing protein [Paludibacteraceae bacterium]|nr:DUF3467 domain-containing protein [Candidatus Colousia faecequi]MCQ2337699.1 DUF3467 domain-containing protein [Paludibacteraceae bacterium]